MLGNILKINLSKMNNIIMCMIIIFPLIFIPKIRRDLLPLYNDAYLVSKEIVKQEHKNKNLYLIVSDYPSLHKEIIAYYTKIPKKNIYFNTIEKYDYKIIIDDINKLKKRNSYIIEKK